MTIRIPGGSVELEAVLREPDEAPLRGAVVLCHPHPRYGGTMDNRVVYRAGKAVLAAGFAALRFNFRGVGASTGCFDEGDGEQADVAVVIGWLEQKYPRLPLALIGFSFGAWVGLQVAVRDPRIRAAVGLGLPLHAYNFDFLADNFKPSLYLVGSLDEFCPREMMARLARRLPPSAAVGMIEGADHFFSQSLEQLQSMITDFFNRLQFDRVPE